VHSDSTKHNTSFMYWMLVSLYFVTNFYVNSTLILNVMFGGRNIFFLIFLVPLLVFFTIWWLSIISNDGAVGWETKADWVCRGTSKQAQLLWWIGKCKVWQTQMSYYKDFYILLYGKKIRSSQFLFCYQVSQLITISRADRCHGDQLCSMTNQCHGD